MNDVDVVALAPEFRDCYRGLFDLYLALRSSEGSRPADVYCEQNADLEVYSSPEYHGALNTYTPYSTTLKLRYGRKTQVDVRWTAVPNRYVVNRDRLDEVTRNCDLFTVFISCRALTGHRRYLDGLEKLAEVLNNAPHVPVRFVFLDAGEVGEEFLAEILRKFGFTETYHTAGTDCTCMNDGTELARDIAVDAADALALRGESNMGVRLMRRAMLDRPRSG